MLPKNLLYENKMQAATARAYTTNISPINGSQFYMNGSTAIINIPTGRNLVLNGAESYLKYRLVYKNGATASAYLRLDSAGCSSAIQRIRLYHSGTMIEEIDNYNLLVSKLLALQAPTSAQNQKYSITHGLTRHALVNPTALSSVYLTCGERLSQNISVPSYTAADIAANAVVTSDYYCPSLVSAVVGTLSTQYTPLFAMSAAPIRLEITFVSDPLKSVCSAQALSTTAADNYVDSLEFIGSFMELGDSAMEKIMDSLGGNPLTYVVPRYQNYIDTKSLANATTTVASLIPAKFSSLRALLVTLRDKDAGAATFFSLGSPMFNLSEYRLRVNGELLPSKAPASKAEFLNELLKAVATVSDLYHTPSVNDDTYGYNQVSVANTESNAAAHFTAHTDNFMLGFDFDIYANADKDKIFSGLNTQNMDLQWVFTFNANSTTPTVRIDYFALHDAVLVCENGNMSVRV